MSAPPYVLGVDVGGSSVKAVAVTEEGEARGTYHGTFDEERRLHFADTVREMIREIRSKQGGEELGMGLSAPGVPDKAGRAIANMPGRLEGLVGLDWGSYLERTEPVPVLNDAQAALQGEVWLGAARGLQDVILLTLGTGVGGAALVDGRLLRGHSGKAGHLGHLCLDPQGPPDICRIPGSLEWAVGNATIQERGGGRYANTHELVERHLAGDQEATKVWLRSVHALACAIASLTNVLDPQMVVLGGGIARAGQALFDPLRESVRRMEWLVGEQHVSIQPALLGEWAGAFGAARQAWSLYRPPGQAVPR